MGTTKSKTQRVIEFIGTKAKFRIIKRNERYIAQQFHGYWKIGFYIDVTWIPEPNNYWEHINYSDAEYVIYKLMKDHTSYVVKEYG